MFVHRYISRLTIYTNRVHLTIIDRERWNNAKIIIVFVYTSCVFFVATRQAHTVWIVAFFDLHGLHYLNRSSTTDHKVIRLSNVVILR